MPNEPSVARRRCTSGMLGGANQRFGESSQERRSRHDDPDRTKEPSVAIVTIRHPVSSSELDRRARLTHQPEDSTATLQKGSPMKLSRRSGRCQRNPSISRMDRRVYLMQPLNRSTLLSDIGMTPALQHAPPAKSTRFRINRTWNAAIIFCAALLIFGSSLRAKYFEDEYAYITQSYYVDLVLHAAVQAPALARYAGDRPSATAEMPDWDGLPRCEPSDAGPGGRMAVVRALPHVRRPVDTRGREAADRPSGGTGLPRSLRLRRGR